MCVSAQLAAILLLVEAVCFELSTTRNGMNSQPKNEKIAYYKFYKIPFLSHCDQNQTENVLTGIKKPL